MSKILIVEDQKEIREILEGIFRTELGFENIVFAVDGLDGFVEAYLQKFDLICTDQEMPFGKGCDMILAIRNKAGLNQHTPLIMISSNATEFSDKLKNVESLYFVDKPIDFARLSRYVKMAMLAKYTTLDLMTL